MMNTESLIPFLPFLTQIKTTVEPYIEQKIIHSVLISFSQNEYSNQISEIQLIPIFYEIKSLEILRGILMMIYAKSKIEPHFDLWPLLIHETIYYPMLYRIKFKSSFFAGNSNLYDSIQKDQTINLHNPPYENLIHYVRFVDTFALLNNKYVESPSLLKSTLYLSKKSICAIYESYLYSKKILTFTQSLKEQIHEILQVEANKSLDDDLKNITVRLATLFEIISIEKTNISHVKINEEILQLTSRLLEIFKIPKYRNVLDEYHEKFNSMYTIKFEQFKD